MLKMPENLLPMPAFGWETAARTEAGVRQCAGASTRYPDDYVADGIGPFLNAIKIAGYVPVLNIIVGVSRIAFNSLRLKQLNVDGASGQFVNSLAEERFVVVTNLLRGIAEILIGPLLLIVDAIKTLCDYHIARRYLEGCTQ